MCNYRILFLLCLVIQAMVAKSFNASSVEIGWIKLLKVFTGAIKQCSKSNKIVFNNSTTTYNNTRYCLKIESLKFFDNILSSDVISLMDGVQLIRDENESNTKNQLSPVKRNIAYDDLNKLNDMDFNTWKYHVLNRITENISTYILQIDIKKIYSLLTNQKDDEIENSVSNARHRRYRNHMLTVMVFGVTALGMILVPMGFQFLAVLGGKALLLAKMALLLASISGLKKIATSGLHYGLYHVPEPPYPYGYYDRGDPSHLRQTNKNLFTDII